MSIAEERGRDETKKVQTFPDDTRVPMSINTGASAMVQLIEFTPSSDRTKNTVQITVANDNNVTLQEVNVVLKVAGQILRRRAGLMAEQKITLMWGRQLRSN